ncbi:MAG: UvrB/UvrC motif-containing protein [Planctomycetota bacterium]
MELSENLCDQCGEREATVHVTTLTDAGPVQRHVCGECYEQASEEPTISSATVFAELLGALAPELQRAENTRCPECGINYIEFRQNLIFGCPRDYEVFSAPLAELLETIHGAEEHVGRVPMGKAQRMTRDSRLEVLKRKLEEVVEAEEFEKAVSIRDEIARLEQDGADNTQ